MHESYKEEIGRRERGKFIRTEVHRKYLHKKNTKKDKKVFLGKKVLGKGGQ